jgi:hypothetical protein
MIRLAKFKQMIRFPKPSSLFNSSFGELNSDMMPDSFHMPSRFGPRHCGQSAESNSFENMNRERSAIEVRQKSNGMTFMNSDFY